MPSFPLIAARPLLGALALVLLSSSLASTQTMPVPEAREARPIVKFYHRPPDPQPIPPAAEERIALFFGTLLEGAAKIETAYGEILKGSRLGEREENLELFVTKTGEMMDNLGRLVDFEHYDTQNVGSRMVVVTYLSWHEIYPVQWRFTFYKPGERWELIDMVFNTNVEDLVH